MEWRKIEGVVGPECEISDTGIVRQKYALINYKPVENHIKAIHTGYGGLKYVYFRGEGKQQLRHVHILVANAFLPNPDNLPYVGFLTDDRGNPAVSNLRWTDKRGHGSREVTRGSKLTRETVAQIKAALASGMKPGKVAELYGTSRDMVSHIRAGRRWGNV